MKKINLIFTSIFILLSFILVSAVFSQDSQDTQDRTIAEIGVQGNKTVSSDTIITKIKVKKGDIFSQEALNEDLKRLYATEYFTNVSIDVEDTAEGVKVTFIVEEKPVIEGIVFEGNSAIRTEKLKATMKSKRDEVLNLSLLAIDIAEIKSLYVKKGYPLIDIKYKVDEGSQPGKAKIIITIDEKTHVKISKVTIAGNSAIKTNKIVKILGTKPAWLFSHGIFKEDALEEDTEKIKLLYDDAGYLDCQVTPRLEYSADGKDLQVTFNVEEGKHYKTGDISLKGNLVLNENDILKKVALKKDKSFSTKALRESVFNIKQLYSNYGYINAIIDVDRRVLADSGNIDVTFNIDPKEPVYIGRIEVRGNTKTKEIIVRRELRVYPGDRYDGEKVKRSKERLYNLGIFEDISFDTEETQTPSFQDLIVNVKETKTGEFAFGGGWSSVDYLIGFVSITQRNFDILNFPTFTGGGQNLTIKGELGTVRGNYSISWSDPWIFGFPYLFGFDFYQTMHQRRSDIGWAYDETRTGGDLKVGKELTDYLRADITYTLENVHIGNAADNASKSITEELGSNLISDAELQLTYDRRDNVYNPTKGYVINAGIENAGGILFGDKDFVKGSGLMGWYNSFFDIIVLELKARGGLGGAYGDTDDIPIYERFFAGGMNTIRGYRERAVGPRDSGSNDPIGGDSILIGNAEVTFPLYEKILKGAFFYDVGNVWGKTDDFLVGGSYKQGIGVGLRIKTPIGPIRLDYGYPLVKNFDDKQNGEFYFSMSHGF